MIMLSSQAEIHRNHCFYTGSSASDVAPRQLGLEDGWSSILSFVLTSDLWRLTTRAGGLGLNLQAVQNREWYLRRWIYHEEMSRKHDWMILSGFSGRFMCCHLSKELPQSPRHGLNSMASKQFDHLPKLWGWYSHSFWQRLESTGIFFAPQKILNYAKNWSKFVDLIFDHLWSLWPNLFDRHRQTFKPRTEPIVLDKRGGWSFVNGFNWHR